MKKKLLFSSALIILLFSYSVNAQTKIGYVITEQIVQNLPEAQAASKVLQSMQKNSVDTLDVMQKELQVKVQDYQQKENLMTEEGRKKGQKEIYDMDAKIKELNQKKSEELKLKNEELMAPIFDKINIAIETVAKEEGFSIVLDKTTLLYGDTQINLTNRVLDLLIRSDKTPAKKKK